MYMYLDTYFHELDGGKLFCLILRVKLFMLVSTVLCDEYVGIIILVITNLL